MTKKVSVSGIPKSLKSRKTDYTSVIGRSGLGNNIIKGLPWKGFLKKGEDLTKKGFRLRNFEMFKTKKGNLYVSNWRSGWEAILLHKDRSGKPFSIKARSSPKEGLRLYDGEIVKRGTLKNMELPEKVVQAVI